jgi:hypothetical protein
MRTSFPALIVALGSANVKAMLNGRDVALTTSDAARRLGVCPERVRQLERAGILRALRTLRGVRIFSGRDVEALRRQRERGR